MSNSHISSQEAVSVLKQCFHSSVWTEPHLPPFVMNVQSNVKRFARVTKWSSVNFLLVQVQDLFWGWSHFLLLGQAWILLHLRSRVALVHMFQSKGSRAWIWSSAERDWFLFQQRMQLLQTGGQLLTRLYLQECVRETFFKYFDEHPLEKEVK